MSERTALAAKLLGSLGRTEPRLTLGAAEAQKLAPLVEEWWARGATTVQVEPRKPGASGYREAAQRGGALARALLQGRPALA
ncbi:hypothetical protein [Streptomyces sp. NPDC002276]